MQGSDRKHLAALVLCEDNLVRAYATVAEARAAHPRLLGQHFEVKETGAKASPQDDCYTLLREPEAAQTLPFPSVSSSLRGSLLRTNVQKAVRRQDAAAAAVGAAPQTYRPTLPGPKPHRSTPPDAVLAAAWAGVRRAVLCAGARRGAERLPKGAARAAAHHRCRGRQDRAAAASRRLPSPRRHLARDGGRPPGRAGAGAMRRAVGRGAARPCVHRPARVARGPRGPGARGRLQSRVGGRRCGAGSPHAYKTCMHACRQARTHARTQGRHARTQARMHGHRQCTHAGTAPQPRSKARARAAEL
eukprot:scaffold3484_cov69-Phaeocystis_antarctica.AAC.8